MSELKQFIVWDDSSLAETYYYCEKRVNGNVTRMTTSFAEATIFRSGQSFWKMAADPKFGSFKVHQAPEKDIFKWQLKNEVPKDRL